LLVPKAALKNRVQIPEIRPNTNVGRLGHLTYEVLIQVDQQFPRPRGHNAEVQKTTVQLPN
jgi:hypothetical protein